MYCTHCGASLQDGTKYCGQCGTALHNSTPLAPHAGPNTDTESPTLRRQSILLTILLVIITASI
jgi:uncharacterized membrane protein YvbJ